MQKVTSVMVVAFLLFCGCASRTRKGDLGQFILGQAIAQGVRPVTTNDLPRIIAKWRFYKNERRVEIMLPPERLSEVKLFLAQAFGPPMTSKGTGAVYADGAVFAVLSCNYFEESTFVGIAVQK